MKVDLFAAVSLDGFVARENGKTDWVKDEELFEQMCRMYGVVCLGKITYDEFDGPVVDSVQHLVLSRKAGQPKHPNVHFVRSVEESLEKAEELGFSRLLVIGGAKTNQAFADAGLIEKLFLDKHSVTLGKGKKLFGNLKRDIPCVLKSETPYPGFVHLECEVLKRG